MVGADVGVGVGGANVVQRRGTGVIWGPHKGG